MIIRFSVDNYTSFSSPTSLSFVAARGSDHAHHLRRIQGHQDRLLPIIGIYGANGAGKSNALSALWAMARMVRRVIDTEDGPGPFRHVPFKLNDDKITAPTTYDLEFVLNDVRYRYGFSFSSERIIQEWLHAYPSGNRQIWFERNANETPQWYFGPGWRLLRHRAAAETPDAELFIATAAHRNHPDALAIRQFFGRWIKPDVSTGNRVAFPKSPLFEPSNADLVLGLLRGADLGVRAFQVLNMRKRITEALLADKIPEMPVENLLSALNRHGDPLALQLGHEGADGQTYWLEPDEESDGTSMLINHLHHILTVLQDGGLLIVDELDQALHPTLIPELLRFFSDPDINPKNAQLVFAAHQTALMEHLRRDELYLAEKDKGGASTLTSIASFRALKREDLERFYREGRFGGLPRVAGLRTAMGLREVTHPAAENS